MKYKLVKGMFPEYLEEENIMIEKDKIVIYFKSKRKSYKCPSNNKLSSIVSTYFTRRIQDLNVIEKPFFLKIRLAKYRCDNPNCRRKIFSEHISNLVKMKGRRTNILDEMLTKFALIHSAEGAARRCNDIKIKVSGDTLLRLSKKWESNIDKRTIHSIGIDEEIDGFAFKKNIITEQ